MVDTHVHFADLGRFSYAGGWVHTGHHPVDYLGDIRGGEAALGRNVTAAVFVQASVLPDQSAAEVAWVADMVDRNEAPFVKAIAGYAPLELGAQATADAVAAMRQTPTASRLLRGVRRILELTPDSSSAAGPTDPCWFNTDAFAEGIAALPGLGLHFELLTRNSSQFSCALTLLRRAQALANVTVVAEHLGSPDMVNPSPAEFALWQGYVEALAALPNVYLKVSGVPERAVGAGGVWNGYTVAQIAPFLGSALAAFPAERAVFGGNWFVVTAFSTYSIWASALRKVLQDIGATEEQQELLFDVTARQVYRLG